MRSRRELLFLSALFVLSLPAVTPRLYSSDEVQYFSYLRSLWFDHDVSFENEYQYFYDHQIARSPEFHTTFLELETAAHRRINYGTMGSAILWSPFYAIGDAAARIMRAGGRDVAIDGYSQPYLSAVAYGSAFYGFATIVLAVASARRLIGARAVSSGVAVWLGTPLLFYMYIAPPFSHACSAFAVALFVTVWLKVRQAWTIRGAVALGAAGALMAMVREQDIFFALGPALDFALASISARRPGDGPGNRVRARAAGAPRPGGNAGDEPVGLTRSVLVAAAGLLAFAIGYLPQLIAYQALNGAPRPSPLVMRKMYWHSPHALQVLADTEHGFLFWTPLAALGIAGLILMTTAPERATASNADARLRAEAPRIGGCMLLMLALQIYVSGAVASWTVAGAFGQRRFVGVTILLVIGLAALREWMRTDRPRIAVNVAVAICVWWNLALTVEFGTSMMDRQRLELKRNAYDAVVTLPKLVPGLMYRYFTERASFYKPAEPAR